MILLLLSALELLPNLFWKGWAPTSFFLQLILEICPTSRESKPEIAGNNHVLQNPDMAYTVTKSVQSQAG